MISNHLYSPGTVLGTWDEKCKEVRIKLGRYDSHIQSRQQIKMLSAAKTTEILKRKETLLHECWTFSWPEEDRSGAGFGGTN